MSLDHYISQVHLKNFYSKNLNNLLYAIRKKDQKYFTPNSESICRIEDNSTNSYLKEARIIEEFLTSIEPKYNSAVTNLLNDKISAETIYVISGFISYVLTCAPAGMRIQSDPLKISVEETGKLLDEIGQIPPPPSELGGETLKSLLESGEVIVEVDPKYAQALGISSILSYISVFGNSSWEILVNPLSNNPIFTSDFPVAIEKTRDPQVLNRIVPLTPKLAVRVKPDISQSNEDPNFSFSKFRYKTKKITRQEIIYINRLITQCAETCVYYDQDCEWIPRFISKNSKYRIEPRTIKIPNGNKTILWPTQEIRKNI